MSDKETKKNVVIVGGGVAGTAIARELSSKLDASKYNLILINPRPYLIYLIAGARLTVAPVDELEKRALIPYDKLFHNGNGTVKIGKVASLSEAGAGKGGEVVLEDGERIPYASLVLTTGSVWPGALDFPQADADVQAHIQAWRSRYEKANHVVIVGGGAVGLGTSAKLVLCIRVILMLAMTCTLQRSPER